MKNKSLCLLGFLLISNAAYACDLTCDETLETSIVSCSVGYSTPSTKEHWVMYPFSGNSFGKEQPAPKENNPDVIPTGQATPKFGSPVRIPSKVVTILSEKPMSKADQKRQEKLEKALGITFNNSVFKNLFANQVNGFEPSGKSLKKVRLV